MNLKVSTLDSEVRWEPRPPHEAPGEGKRLVATEVAAERRRVQLLQHPTAQLIARRYANPVTATPPAQQQARAPHKRVAGLGPFGRDQDPRRVHRAAFVGLCGAAERGERWVGEESTGEGVGKVGMKEARSLGGRAHLSEDLGGGLRCRRKGENLPRGRVLGVPRRRGGGLTIGEPLAGQKFGWVSAAWDMDHTNLNFGNCLTFATKTSPLVGSLSGHTCLRF